MPKSIAEMSQNVRGGMLIDAKSGNPMTNPSGGYSSAPAQVAPSGTPAAKPKKKKKRGGSSSGAAGGFGGGSGGGSQARGGRGSAGIGTGNGDVGSNASDGW